MKYPISISLIVILGCTSLLFIFQQSPPVIFIQSVIQKIASPLSNLYDLRAGNEIKDTKSEIFRLKDQNQKLIEQLVEFQKIKNDNIALRSQFEQTQFDNYDLLPARVIGFTGRSLAPDSLIIDKGEKDGIKKNMAAIVGQNLIGKVNKVGPYFAKVILSTSSSFSTVAKTVDNSSQGVVQGENDFVTYTNVSIKDILKKDDIVLSKGDTKEDGIGIPPDLVIGKISSINKSESSPTQNAKIEQTITYSKLTLIFIVKKFQ